jgi:uncharacterized protein YjgD (DUF1641 family)
MLEMEIIVITTRTILKVVVLQKRTELEIQQRNELHQQREKEKILKNNGLFDVLLGFKIYSDFQQNFFIFLNGKLRYNL